jgi:hypothetical protein
LELHVPRDIAVFFPTRPLALERVPFRLDFIKSVAKYILQREIEFAQIVLSKSILIPSHAIQQETVDSGDWELERGLPFGIQGFGDRLGGIFGIAKGENEVLDVPNQLQLSRMTSSQGEL